MPAIPPEPTRPNIPSATPSAPPPPVSREEYINATKEIVACVENLGYDAGTEERYGQYAIFVTGAGGLDALPECDSGERAHTRQVYTQWWIDPLGIGDQVYLDCFQENALFPPGKVVEIKDLTVEIEKISQGGGDEEIEIMRKCMYNPQKRPWNNES